MIIQNYYLSRIHRSIVLKFFILFFKGRFQLMGKKLKMSAVCVYICLDELQYNQADVGLYVVVHTYKHTNICLIVWQTAYQLTDRTRIGGKFKRRKNPKMVLFLPHFDFDFWSSCQQEMNMNFTKLYSLNDCKKTDFLTFPNFHQKYLVPTSRKLAFFDRI